MVHKEKESLDAGHGWTRICWRGVIGLALLLCIPVIGQAPFPEQFPSGNTGKAGQRYPDSNTTPFGQEQQQPPDQKRLRMLNAQRQKEIVSDTDKLLKLAKELNDEVAGSNPDTLTEAQLRKVAEIGKLARNVKEKMSYSLGGYPNLNPPVNMNQRDPGIQ